MRFSKYEEQAPGLHSATDEPHSPERRDFLKNAAGTAGAVAAVAAGASQVAQAQTAPAQPQVAQTAQPWWPSRWGAARPG